MQESVGATSARACVKALSIYKSLGLRARPMTCLYDSLVSLAPLEERHVVSKLHDVVMSQVNTWIYEDNLGRRVLKYEIDNELNYRWSTKPTKEQAKQLEDPEWYPIPDHLQWVLKCKNWDFLVS